MARWLVSTWDLIAIPAGSSRILSSPLPTLSRRELPRLSTAIIPPRLSSQRQSCRPTRRSVARLCSCHAKASSYTAASHVILQSTIQTTFQHCSCCSCCSHRIGYLVSLLPPSSASPFIVILSICFVRLSFLGRQASTPSHRLGFHHAHPARPCTSTSLASACFLRTSSRPVSVSIQPICFHCYHLQPLHFAQHSHQPWPCHRFVDPVASTAATVCQRRSTRQHDFKSRRHFT